MGSTFSLLMDGRTKVIAFASQPSQVNYIIQEVGFDWKLP